DGVNVASRIHGLAPPGGICVSEHVYDEIRNKPGMHAKYLGQKRLRNVSRPIGVYSLSGLDTDTTSAQSGRSGMLRRVKPRTVALAVIAVLVLLTGYGVYGPYRSQIIAAKEIYLPRILPKAVDQKMGFCTASDGVQIAYASSGKGPPLVIMLG